MAPRFRPRRPRGKVSSGGEDAAAPSRPGLDPATWEAIKDKGEVWWIPPPKLG